jgi:hypothetical protein
MNFTENEEQLNPVILVHYKTPLDLTSNLSFGHRVQGT